MIKLDRGEAPKELTEEIKLKLTKEFKQNGTNVWAKEFIKKALLEFSNEKCCYCETKLIEESKYMHVEHFHHKDEYKDEVVEWNNLLPSCERCNKCKSSHDTKKDPIINPTEDDPKDSLILRNYRFKAKNDLGQMTIDVLNLNDRKKAMLPRFYVGDAIVAKIEEQLEKIMDSYESYEINARKRSRMKSTMKGILREGLPDAEYSAVVATVLFEDEKYAELKEILKTLNIWDSEMDDMEIILRKSKFDTSLQLKVKSK